MVHTFKFGGHRFAYDSASGSLHALDELGFKMLDYIELPMPKDCPSALRYDLAKYDSEAISVTYDAMYKLYADGKLYSPDADFAPTGAEVCEGAVIKSSGGAICGHSNPHVPDGIAESGETLAICETAGDSLTCEELPALLKELEKLARELIKQGKTSMFAPVRPYEHTFSQCKGCWARGLCSAGAPSEVRCELERKRAECELALNAARN